MLFLNTWLLVGLLGISIPVIIHLLNRRHAKIVDWGAMRFLLDSLISRRRRVLLEEMLLLAARCLLMALIALALARPFISANSSVPWVVVLPAALTAVVLFGVSFALWRYPVWRLRVIFVVVVLVALCGAAILAERRLNLKRFGGGGSRDVALVLDGSSSMTMTIDGESNFARAVKEAATYIESAPRGFSFSLIIGGSVPNVLAPAPTPDRKRLNDLLLEAQPVQGTMQALDTLAVAATTLARGDNPGKQVVMIGDGQSVGWRTGQTDLWAHLQEAFTRLPAPPLVIWRRLPMPQTIRNATLSSISLSRQVIGTDREVRIDVTISNTGGEAITPQEVRLKIGEKTLSDRSLSQLPPGVSATVSFRHRFERVGTEVINAQIVANDEMPGDDEALRVVHVMDSLKVLVVDSAASRHYLDRAGAFVSLALMPDMQELNLPETRKGDFLVEPELLSLSELTARGGAGDAGVVVLVDVPELPVGVAASLAEFVGQGGGLLVVAGNRANSSFYNDWTGLNGTVMPLSLDDLIQPAETNRPGLATDSFYHEALDPLSKSDLGTVAFANYWTSSGDETESVRIGARFDNGEPFVSERSYGGGLVLQVNAPLDTRAGNLVARQGFVPLVHELVYYLARPVAANLNLPPSRGATIQLSVTGQGQTGGGLRAEYHRRDQKTSNPVFRVDPTISRDLSWPGSRPEQRFGYTVIWRGTITVPKTGEYTFERGPENQYEIVINRRTVLKGKRKRADVELAVGERYDFQVSLICKANSESLAMPLLTMSGPGLPAQTIPSAFLSPAKAGRDQGEPDGTKTTVQGPGRALTGRYVAGANGALALRVDENLVPGLYAAKVPQDIIKTAKPLLNEDGDILFGVMVSGEESRLTPLSPEDITFIGSYLQFLAAGSAEDVLRAMRGKAVGREVWRSLFFGVLALLSLEILLTRWIAIQRSKGASEDVTFEDANLPSSAFRDQLEKLGK